ncbi:MAG: serine hydrolase domain-containing protein [Lysobacterales bacterium]
MKRGIFCLCLEILLAIGGASAQTSNPESNSVSPGTWEGLWVAERYFGVQLDGPLTLQLTPDGWIAQVQGERAVANRQVADDGSVDWSFSFFDLGRFEGRQSSKEQSITGHWIQPAANVYYYPFATPVTLKPVGANTFDGILDPIRESYSLSIPLIAEDPDNPENPQRYRTYLRNPERNTGVYFRIETATVTDDDIRFSNSAGEVIGTAQIIDPGARFTLAHRGVMFEFTRATRQTADGFYPRRSQKPVKHLLRPPETGDGWLTATPSESGLAAAPIVTLLNKVSAFEPKQLREPYLHSLLVAHRGKLVVEEYFHGHHREMPHDSRSSGKTVVSALLGMAIHQGIISDVDQPAYRFYGGVEAFANPDERKERLTLRHLVTMTPGLACNDDDNNSPGNETTMQEQSAQPDWYQYALDLPMLNEPGEVGYYCTAGINLVGGAISHAAGYSLARFFHESFAAPLQLPYYRLNLSPRERAYMGGGIQLRPRDFLKLGQLFLNEGVWNGTRLVSRRWVKESAAAHASLSAEDNYGFGWWRQTFDVDGQTISTYSASGNGGQMLFVVPELELTVMINAGNYSDGRTRGAMRDQILTEAVFPAAMEQK